MVERLGNLREASGFILCLSAGVVALRFSSQLLSSFMLTLTLFLLLLGVLCAKFGDERRRSYYWGFSVFGFLYLVLTYGLFNETDRRNIFTTYFLDRLQISVHPPGDPRMALWDRSQFQLIGHSLFALLIARVGGLLASRTERRSRTEDANETARNVS